MHNTSRSHTMPRQAGGRPQTAAERGLRPSHGQYTEGDSVKVTGLIGDRFTVLGFRDDEVDLFEQRPGTGYRTFPVDRIRHAAPTAAHTAHVRGLA